MGGHDVGQQWFPIYRNDSYEQIAAPQKTGEICLIYTFSTSKKYVDIAVGGKKSGQKSVKPHSGKANAVSANLKKGTKLQEETKAVMASQDVYQQLQHKLEQAKEKANEEKVQRKRLENEKRKQNEEITKLKNQLEEEKEK